MKRIILLFSVCILAIAACKSGKETASSSLTADSTPKTIGKVSHQYRSGGCSSVILVSPASSDETPVILIPKDKLPSKFDVDGMEISFNYLTLKMPQPAGCTSGMPAEITNISKK